MPDPSARPPWQFDRRVPLAMVVAVVSYVGYGVWWSATTASIVKQDAVQVAQIQRTLDGLSDVPHLLGEHTAELASLNQRVALTSDHERRITELENHLEATSQTLNQINERLARMEERVLFIADKLSHPGR